jgi:hypothetical protein
MKLLKVVPRAELSDNSIRRLAVVALASVALLPSMASAKEPSLTAIELYDGASGPQYVQLTDVLINGKVELRNCDSSQSSSIEKSAFGKLSKLTMAAGGVLKRDMDGVLRYGIGNGPANCVVPENMKFEHSESLSPAMMADMSELSGHAVMGGSTLAGAQPLTKGVELVFIAAPDTEFADYLLAQRQGTQAGWQKYLTQYPNANHTDDAKRALATLYIDAGAKALATYGKSTSSSSPAYPELEAAETAKNNAHALLPNSQGEVKLGEGISTCLSDLVDRGRAELGAYSTALTSNTPGYVHLQKAKEYADAISTIDLNFPALGAFQSDVMKNLNAVNSAIRQADSEMDKKNWDAAVKAIQPYRQFAGEEPRVAHILDSTYAAYFAQGKQLSEAKDWSNATQAYRNALNAKETDDARAALEETERENTSSQDESAAMAAREKSKAYEDQKQMIPAYEVLVSLPIKQQAIVKDDIARLAPGYVTAASLEAKKIARLYDSIKGVGDEKAVESAYVYLQRASELSQEDAAKQAFDIRAQNLGDELSVWFLDRAKHFLQKPVGSGTELGWAYLKKAESYKAANLEAVHDQMKSADPAHQMHSKLSFRVQFIDQTSQRQSQGFAAQMESAIANGLQTPGLPVRVIRPSDHEEIESDFLIAGEILERNISLHATVESKDSNYRAETHDVQSDEWTKLNTQYESAQDQLRTAQAALQAAGKNKKAAQKAQDDVQSAQSNVNDLRAKLNATPRNQTTDVTRPYTYQKTTYNMVNRIILQFHIDDNFTGQKGELVQVPAEDKRQLVVISQVKAEDTNNIKNEGTTPEKEDLQNELDNTEREDLIKKVHEQVIELPNKLYEAASKREQDGNNDDAGEAYMRFLYIAPTDQLDERERAEKFLRDQYNFQKFPNDVRETPHSTPSLAQGMSKPAPGTR